MSLKIINLDTPTLGDRSYIAHDGKTALVVDPQRDIDRVEEILNSKGIIIGAVVETHMHNDYVSGGLILARKYGVPYITSAEDEVKFDRVAVKDREIVTIGDYAIQAIHTPGHTFTHMSYILLESDDVARGIFTGGSMLHGSTGRPDLLGWDQAATLAGLQHGSAHRIAELLEDRVSIHHMGAVVTLRDRTEHIGLMRELNSVRNLTDALRAQQHEYSNRMHTLYGLLELRRYNEASEYLVEISAINADLAETLHDNISNPTITALLIAKVSIARERGVELTINAEVPLNDIAIEQNALITIIGNLLDNAIDAASGSKDAHVDISVTSLEGGRKLIRVHDSGPGLPYPNPEVIFEDGYTTKPPRHGNHRGIGLAIVQRLVKQADGEITCFNQNGATIVVELPTTSNINELVIT